MIQLVSELDNHSRVVIFPCHTSVSHVLVDSQENCHHCLLDQLPVGHPDIAYLLVWKS